MTSRRGLTAPLAALLAVATLVACIEVAAVLDAEMLEYPSAFAALGAWTVVGFAGAGIYWRLQRSANRLGAILIALGICALPQMLQGLTDSVPFSVGVLFDAPVTLLVWYAILAFPSGRLDRAGRAVLGAGAAFLGLVFLPWVLVSPQIEGGSPLSRCAGECPANALLVTDGGRGAEVLSDLVQAGRLLIAVAIAVTLVVRLVRASAPRRRSLMPVALVAIGWIIAFGAYGLGVNVLDADGAAENALTMSVVVARGLLPAAFLLAPVLARAFAGVALERMVERLGTRASVGERERVIGDALDDPSLRLGFWLPGPGGYVDGEGRPLARPAPGSGRAWTSIGAGDPPEAAILHDPALAEEPELLRAAGRTLLLALENTRLHDELQEASGELERSRSRLVAAGTTDRRRLERELHDRTQQQLVALRVRLGLAVERADGDEGLARVLAQLGSDVEAAVADLRGIAGELYPPLLADEGLPAALRAAARHAGTSPRRVGSAGVGRYPEEVEGAMYFTLEEAITAAAEVPGGAESIRVLLRDEAGALSFELATDVAFVPSGNGRLSEMSALLRAVGGTVELTPRPGGGQVIRGVVPAAGRPRAG